jgi:hypothetical protein
VLFSFECGSDLTVTTAVSQIIRPLKNISTLSYINSHARARIFPMRKTIKLTIIVGLILVSSWYLAVWWAGTTNRWFYPFFEGFSATSYPLLKTVLSSDVSEAEDQLWFLSHWLPVVLTLIMFFLLGQKIIVRHRRIDSLNLSLTTDSNANSSAQRSKATT